MPSGHSASAVAFAVGVGLVKPVPRICAGPGGTRALPTPECTPARTGPPMCFSVPRSGPAQPWSPGGGGLSGRPFPRPPGPGRRPGVPGGGRAKHRGEHPRRVLQGRDCSALLQVFPKAYITLVAPEEDLLAADRRRQPPFRDPCTRGVGRRRNCGHCSGHAAVERSLPLLVLPGGTLNHFARDAGTGSLKEAVAAAERRSGPGRRRHCHC
jgi:hypothetical protein